MDGHSGNEGSNLIKHTLLDLARQCGPEKSIGPSDVAMAIVGKDEKDWRLLMKPIRSIAVELARKGIVCIKRKGKTVDPDNFKGVYRISISDNLA